MLGINLQSGEKRLCDLSRATSIDLLHYVVAERSCSKAKKMNTTVGTHLSPVYCVLVLHDPISYSTALEHDKAEPPRLSRLTAIADESFFYDPIVLHADNELLLLPWNDGATVLPVIQAACLRTVSWASQRSPCTLPH